MQVLDDQLKAFWELESFGISTIARSIHDKFEDTVRFINGRYEVELPWKESHPTLHEHYHLSLSRLRGLLKHLRHDPEVLQEYDSTIQDQLHQGIVELVDPSDDTEKIQYFPHHAVVRHSKETTKVRVVYDASARSEGPSLNECLHAGPKFNQNIMDILLRFRVYRIAIIADVEKALLMISMDKEDRDVLRFLEWMTFRMNIPILLSCDSHVSYLGFLLVPFFSMPPFGITWSSTTRQTRTLWRSCASPSMWTI